MKVQSLCILAIFFCGACANKQEVTPVQKVIQLLGGMLEKGKEAKHIEQLAFAKAKQVCTDTEQVKVHVIEEETEDQEKYTAEIKEEKVTHSSILRKIALLNKNDDIWSGDLIAATKVRDIEHADYQNLHDDYSESIDALQRAIATLQKKTKDVAQKASLLQSTSFSLMRVKQALMVPPHAKKVIDAFLQTSGEDKDAQDLGLSAPEANGYEFQSHGIIDMLEKLMDKFVDERTNAEKEEANSKNAYQMLLQKLNAEIDEAHHQLGIKQEQDGEILQAKAQDEGNLQDVTADKQDDTTFLHDVEADCTMQESDYEARQELREAEIQNLEKTMEILQNGVVGNADKHLPKLIQLGAKSTSLGQLRSNIESNLQTQLQDRVLNLLRSKAKQLNSRILALTVTKISEDPFSKIKKMLKDLIVRLMEEANEEAEHKGWCDTELGTNEQTRKEKTNVVEKQHAQIDELEASLAKLTEDISDLTKQVAELDKAVMDATTVRQEEHKTNEETVKDAKEAQAALAAALNVLQEFYAKAAEATSMIQAEPYKGMQGESGGVIGMLEVIESDFARLEAETKASEATAQKEFDTFTQDSKVDKAQKSVDIEHKTAKKQDQSQTLTQTKADLEGTQKELDAALQYYDKLKPTCIESGVSYEDRVARRKEEIESLQEAMKILNGEDIA